jgi:uncharacterized phage protein gp47/JayE
MAYAAPTITPAGLVVPSFNDILTSLLQGFSGIYGANVYLQPDGADYQFLSLIALKLSDTMNCLTLVANGRSPVTAIGTQLDSIVKLNGLVRRSATNSTALLTIVGSVGTVLTNSAAQDTNGYLWSIPSPTTITASSISVTATCQTSGAITANAGAINIISTPTSGWTSVTNPSAASPGTNVEADSALRARQALSVAAPSSTRLAGTYSDVAAVPGVTSLNVIENPSGAVDSYGNPAHSLTVVVEGGNSTAIAQAIYDNKGIGPNVNGTNPASGATLVSISITDANNGNLTQIINFFRPGLITALTSVFILPLAGYTTAAASAIQTAVAAYLNGLAIGQPIIYSEVYWAVVNSQTTPSTALFSVKAMYTGATSGGLANVTVASGGSGYVLNDSCVVTGGGGNAHVLVTGVVAGVVTAIQPVYLTQLGTGYAPATGVTTTGGTGTGLTVNIVSVGPPDTFTSDDNIYFYQLVQAGAVNVVVVSS